MPQAPETRGTQGDPAAESPDKRLHPRVPLVLRVEYPGESPAANDWTENISAAGLFVRTLRRWALGQRVVFTVSFPGLLPPTPVDGHVTWVRPGTPSAPAGCGVTVGTDADRRRLAEIVLTVLNPPAFSRPEPFKILIAEDNPMLKRSYERAFSTLSQIARTKLRVSFAGDGAEALAQIEEHGADMLILDVYMPVMDGFALIRKVRTNPSWRDVPIIVVTGGYDDEAVHATSLGVDAFLQKPFQMGQLLETIACLVASRAAR